jgi:hypothetical protein
MQDQPCHRARLGSSASPPVDRVTPVATLRPLAQSLIQTLSDRLSLGAGLELLCVPASPSDVRADQIRQMMSGPTTRDLAKALIGLETELDK